MHAQKEWIPHQNELVEMLTAIKGMTSITVSPNPKRTNVIMGDSYKVLWGQGTITDYIGNVKYQISPLSFYQVNPVQTEKFPIKCSGGRARLQIISEM